MEFNYPIRDKGGNYWGSSSSSSLPVNIEGGFLDSNQISMDSFNNLSDLMNFDYGAVVLFRSAGSPDCFSVPSISDGFVTYSPLNFTSHPC